MFGGVYGKEKEVIWVALTCIRGPVLLKFYKTENRGTVILSFSRHLWAIFFSFFKFPDQTGCNKRPQILPLLSSCSLFPKLVKPLSSIILNMARINNPTPHRKCRIASEIPPTTPFSPHAHCFFPTTPRDNMGEGGGENPPYVIVNLSHKVPHSQKV